MAQYTLTYSEGAKGWPSFYSYIPEWLIGTNNYLYSFQDGQLWRHNVNNNRSTFYGTTFPSSVQTVLNASPLEPKVYKTLELVGTPGVGWGTGIISNLQGGFSTDYNEVSDSYPVSSKEGHMFSYIISPPTPLNVNALELLTPGSNTYLGDQRLAQRSFQMVAEYRADENVETVAGTISRVSFARGTVIPPTLSIGDRIIVSSDTVVAQWAAGVIVDFGQNNPDTGSTGCAVDGGGTCFGLPYVDVDLAGMFWNLDQFATSSANMYPMYYLKNDQVESYGALGDFIDVTLSLTTTSAVELFSVQSEVMKSNP
jgi:hypothetical protein